MQAELDTFPVPDHLILVESRSEGPSTCFAGDCPRATRYYVSERTVDETCNDMMNAVSDWGADAEWHHNIERNNCGMSTHHGRDELAVSVFPASRLRPDVATNLDPADADRYPTAVIVGLSVP